jgi:hypothetical protein
MYAGHLHHLTVVKQIRFGSRPCFQYETYLLGPLDGSPAQGTNQLHLMDPADQVSYIYLMTEAESAPEACF